MQASPHPQQSWLEAIPQPYLLVHPSRQILAANRQACSLLLLPQLPLPLDQSPLAQIKALDSKATPILSLPELLADPGGFEPKLCLGKLGHREAWLLVQASPLVDVTGERLLGLSLASHEPHNQGEFYRGVLESINNGVFVTNRDDVLYYCNQALQEITGYDALELTGISLTLEPPERPFLAALKKDYLKAKSLGQAVHFISLPLEDARGRQKAQSGWMIPRYEGRKFLGMVCSISDVTYQREMNRQLEVNIEVQSLIRALLQLALEPLTLQEQMQRALELLLVCSPLGAGAKGSIFLLDPATRRLTLLAEKGMEGKVQKHCRDIELGHCFCGKVAQLNRIEILQPEGGQPLCAASPHASHLVVPITRGSRVIGVLNLFPGEGGSTELEKETLLITLSQTLAGIIIHTKAKEELKGYKDRLEIMVRERTLDLEESQAMYKTLHDNVQEGVVMVQEGRVIHANRVLEQMLGYGEGKLLNLSIQTLVSPDCMATLEQLEENLGEAGGKTEEAELQLLHRTGKKIFANLKSKVVMHQGQRTIVNTLIDTTAAKERERSAQEHLAVLEEAKKAAEEANQAKSDFLANMSHELRTPMHGILSFSEKGLLRLQKADRAKLGSYFERIQTSGKRLLGLVNNLLDLSKLEAGRMNYCMDSQDLKALFQEIQQEFSALMEAKELGFEIHCRGFEPKGFCDAERIKQVMANLLSNAIKFSPRGGVVTVVLTQVALTSAGWRTAGIKCQVLDQGVGLPEDELQEVFNKFAQSSKTKSGAGGTGLGLSISREIIEDHGGKIWAANRPEGGAIFGFILPQNEPARKLLGELLLEKGYISKEQLTDALASQIKPPEDQED